MHNGRIRQNQGLPSDRQVRIVLVDMQRPWKEIRNRADWRRYDVDRDPFMAENILADVRKHPRETRHGLFIVGVAHATLGGEYFDGTPVMTAGRHLCRKLGRENVYAVFPHMPVQTNWGRVDAWHHGGRN